MPELLHMNRAKMKTTFNNTHAKISVRLSLKLLESIVDQELRECWTFCNRFQVVTFTADLAQF